MKRLVLVSLAAVALASCAKNEVVSIADAPKEINFQTLQSKNSNAVTKGEDDNAINGFSKENTFRSYAYFVPNGKTWDANSTDDDVVSYYDDELASYKNTSVFATETTYYWPKTGSLTFFAWSTNDKDVNDLTAEQGDVDCNKEDGITITAYDMLKAKNMDVLVAKVAKDKTANDYRQPGNPGVHTIFEHALSRLEFEVVTVDYAGNVTDLSASGISFKVKSITIKNINNKLDYAQGIADVPAHDWTKPQTAEEIDLLPVYTNSEGFLATNQIQTMTPSDDDYFVVIPQTFEDEDVIVVEYEMSIKYSDDYTFTETIVWEDKLSDVYLANEWEAGINYITTIQLGITQIYFVPEQTEWLSTGTIPGWRAEPDQML